MFKIERDLLRYTVSSINSDPLPLVKGLPLIVTTKGKALERDPKQDRQQAHALLDLLPDEKVVAVRTLLEVMVEPSGSLAAEDEELTPETAAALDDARASLARGQGIPHEEILREFGIKK